MSSQEPHLRNPSQCQVARSCHPTRSGTDREPWTQVLWTGQQGECALPWASSCRPHRSFSLSLFMSRNQAPNCSSGSSFHFWSASCSNTSSSMTLFVPGAGGKDRMPAKLRCGCWRVFVVGEEWGGGPVLVCAHRGTLPPPNAFQVLPVLRAGHQQDLLQELILNATPLTSATKQRGLLLLLSKSPMKGRMQGMEPRSIFPGASVIPTPLPCPTGSATGAHLLLLLC